MLNARPSGFSLIELAIALAIMALLVMMGLPSLTAYLQNTKLRSAAETFHVGMQQARAEAVRRNAQVQFILTTDVPIDSNKNTTALSDTAGNWMIRTPDPAIPGAFLFVEGKSALQGAGSSSQTVTVNGGGTNTVTFTGFGATTLGGSATFAFSNPAGGACAPTGPMRCLNIQVSVGGQARMCDPSITAAGDTRRCS